MNKLCEMVQYEHQFMFHQSNNPSYMQFSGHYRYPCMLNLSIEDFKLPYINDSS